MKIINPHENMLFALLSFLQSGNYGEDVPSPREETPKKRYVL